jgi:hypothetical protein
MIVNQFQLAQLGVRVPLATKIEAELTRTWVTDTNNPNIHTTVAQVTNDAQFTNVRDTATNMHDNAESYA